MKNDNETRNREERLDWSVSLNEYIVVDFGKEDTDYLYNRNNKIHEIC